jgi:hypothetical protein
MPRLTIPLYADGDFEHLGELKKKVFIAQRNAELAVQLDARAGDDDADQPDLVQQAMDEFNTAVDAARDRAEEWVLHSIGWKEWRDLVSAHPARKITETVGEDDDEQTLEVVHPDDRQYGVNTETFGLALLLWRDPDDEALAVDLDGDEDDLPMRTVLQPDLSPETLVRRVKRLSEGQFETLWLAALQLNVGGVQDPKLAIFSTGGRSSGS